MKRDDIFPRVLIAAPGSGSGKTLITCALLQMLKRRGFDPAAFKCGPDYIDPMFHKTVLKVPSRNLDLFLAGEEGIKKTLQKGNAGRDIGILEGVMGFYDGFGAVSMTGSSYDICRLTSTPAVLVINCKGMSRSILPVVKGFCEYAKENVIKGIILNNCSKMIVKEISDEILSETGVPVIGFLPALKDLPLESRHLGLVMPDEIPDLLKVIDQVSENLEEGFDFDTFLKIANEAGDLIVKNKNSDYKSEDELRTNIFDGLRIGIAKDEAFCFYYEDNLELIRDMDVELIPFSPIHDRELPKVSGLIIGGGYPELYAKELSENISMRESIRDAAKKGLPIMAECGGFLYLQEELTSPEGEKYSMAGVFDGASHMTGKLGHFGYVNVSPRNDNPYLLSEETVRGHEFHYYDTTDNGNLFLMRKPAGNREWEGYQMKNNAIGGFAHLYYPSCATYIERFLKKCSMTGVESIC